MLISVDSSSGGTEGRGVYPRLVRLASARRIGQNVLDLDD